MFRITSIAGHGANVVESFLPGPRHDCVTHAALGIEGSSSAHKQGRLRRSLRPPPLQNTADISLEVCFGRRSTARLWLAFHGQPFAIGKHQPAQTPRESGGLPFGSRHRPPSAGILRPVRTAATRPIDVEVRFQPDHPCSGQGLPGLSCQLQPRGRRAMPGLWVQCSWLPPNSRPLSADRVQVVRKVRQATACSTRPKPTLAHAPPSSPHDTPGPSAGSSRDTCRKSGRRRSEIPSPW